MGIRMGVVSFFVIGLPLFAKSELSTAVLPAGINSPSVRVGMISNLDQSYTEKGSLVQSADLRAIEFNARRITGLDSRVQALVDLFNQFGRYNLGDQLHMGNLQIDSRPEIQYTGLVYARGITEKWTIGAGIPVIQYKNSISVQQSQNNLSVFRDIAQAMPDPAARTRLIDGINELGSQNIPLLFREELRRKGYNDLSNQNATFMGDLQISSLYRFNTQEPFETLFRVNVNLPTGPQFNPDNLAALNQFGYTYIEPQVIAAYSFRTKWKASAMLATRFYVPDRIMARVPKGEDDLLPAEDQKESVDRAMGTKFIEGAQLNYEFNDTWSAYGGSELSQKLEDQFHGSNNGRYDLLGKGSASESLVVSFGATFSSVENYKKRKKGIPAMITAQISDTIYGRNLERQLIQEVNAIIFF